MVQNAGLKRKLAAIPVVIQDAARDALEAEAIKMVAAMDRLKPVREIKIDWTWGDTPAGALTIGQVRGQRFGKLAITIYAKAPQGSGFSAAWFEFGTAERAHRSGKSTGRIVASPYFYPVFRSRQRAARGAITRKIKASYRKFRT